MFKAYERHPNNVILPGGNVDWAEPAVLIRPAGDEYMNSSKPV